MVLRVRKIKQTAPSATDDSILDQTIWEGLDHGDLVCCAFLWTRTLRQGPPDAGVRQYEGSSSPSVGQDQTHELAGQPF